jgi:cytochrome P450
MEAAERMDFDPYSHALHDDPYPVYAQLRERYPVHYNETRDFWHIARYADVLEAIGQPQVFSSGRGISLALRNDAQQSPMPMMIVMDPPRHDQLRNLVNRGFTPRRIRELEHRVRAIATEYIDRFIDNGRCDLWEAFAAPLPTTVIAELLGVPASDREWFKEQSTLIVATAEKSAEAGRGGAALELGKYLFDQFAEKRKQPRDDLMSELLEAELEGERLTDPELVGFAVLLLIAGNETTTNLISNATVLLDRHPDERAKLVANPGLIGTAIEEFLRFDPPVQGIVRTLAEDIDFKGHTIPEGGKVYLVVGAANRDPAYFEEPERFDVTRSPNRHLSFGFGTHFCLGASLARLEGRVAFEEMLRRFPEFHISGPTKRLHGDVIRGLLRVPLEFKRAAT